MTEYKIETNVPLPPKASGRRVKGGGIKGLLTSMNVGDSIFLPGRTHAYASGTCTNAQKASGFKYTARKVDGGLRIWRVS